MHQSLPQEVLLEQFQMQEQLLQLDQNHFIGNLQKIQKLRVVLNPKKKRKHLLLPLHLLQQLQLQKKGRKEKVNMNTTMTMNGKKRSLKQQKLHLLPRPQQRQHLQSPSIEKLVWALLQVQTQRRDRTIKTLKLRHRTQVDIHQ
jgi:hypothetical protein